MARSRGGPPWGPSETADTRPRRDRAWQTKTPSLRHVRRRDEARRDPRGATLIATARGSAVPAATHSVRCDVWTHPAYLRPLRGAFFHRPLVSAFARLTPSRASTRSRVAVGAVPPTSLSLRGLGIRLSARCEYYKHVCRRDVKCADYRLDYNRASSRRIASTNRPRSA
jgi:hypothetical protein